MNTASRVDQVMAGFSVGDATSNAALLMRDALRQGGIASEIFVDDAYIMPAIQQECRPLSSYTGAPNDTLIHHLGNWSPAADFFLTCPARKVLLYHNITPGRFFDGVNDDEALRLKHARMRLPDIVGCCDGVWADSAYNAAELQPFTKRAVSVFPLPFSPASWAVQPNNALVSRLQAPLTTWLSVGRLVPNKRLEDLIRAFAVYHQQINPFSRLFLVGSDRSAPRYVTYLKALVHECGVSNVCFEGFVWPDALAAYYQLADLYVCTSDHEGYCLPLVEAMFRNIPVIAKRTGGTPEAMNGAGILYDSLTPQELATLVDITQTDRALRNSVQTAQRLRIQREQERDLAAELHILLNG